MEKNLLKLLEDDARLSTEQLSVMLDTPKKEIEAKLSELEGNGTIVESSPESQEENVSPVSAGDCLYCQKGHSHSLRNTSQDGDLVFYAVVPKQ